jgi:hypothetical protein
MKDADIIKYSFIFILGMLAVTLIFCTFYYFREQSPATNWGVTCYTGKILSITEQNGELELKTDNIIGAYLILPLTIKDQLEVGKKYNIYFSEPIELNMTARNLRFTPSMRIEEVQ